MKLNQVAYIECVNGKTFVGNVSEIGTKFFTVSNTNEHFHLQFLLEPAGENEYNTPSGYFTCKLENAEFGKI